MIILAAIHAKRDWKWNFEESSGGGNSKNLNRVGVYLKLYKEMSHEAMMSLEVITKLLQ